MIVTARFHLFVTLLMMGWIFLGNQDISTNLLQRAAQRAKWCTYGCTPSERALEIELKNSLPILFWIFPSVLQVESDLSKLPCTAYLLWDFDGTASHLSQAVGCTTLGCDKEPNFTVGWVCYKRDSDTAWGHWLPPPITFKIKVMDVWKRALELALFNWPDVTL